MQEKDNPYDNIQSFDTIYYSALEVLIVASANGVCLPFTLPLHV